MKDWYSGVYKAFILASVIAFIISTFSTGKVSYGAELSGYISLIIGIMMILVILFKTLFMGISDASSITTALMSTGPFILMFGIIGFILYLMIVYKEAIIDGHVSPNYQIFSNIAIILFLIQVYVVYTNISSDKFATTGKMSRLTTSAIYLFGILTLICSLILFTILKYFRTDG